MMTRRRWLASLLSVWSVPAALARPRVSRATHAPDHRFIVLGFVLDEAGGPLGGTSVVLTRLKTGLEYTARAEPDGLFLLVVHLHDEDEGERLRVRALGATTEVQARFDPRDHKVERGTRLDLKGVAWTESRARFAETLRAFLSR